LSDDVRRACHQLGPKVHPLDAHPVGPPSNNRGVRQGVKLCTWRFSSRMIGKPPDRPGTRWPAGSAGMGCPCSATRPATDSTPWWLLSSLPPPPPSRKSPCTDGSDSTSGTTPTYPTGLGAGLPETLQEGRLGSLLRKDVRPVIAAAHDVVEFDDLTNVNVASG